MRKIFPEYKEVTLAEVYADLYFQAAPTRPFAAINMVSSVDGRTTIRGTLSSPRIGSPVDRELMGWVRHGADLILRGAQTVRANPTYPKVPDALVSERLRKGLTEQPRVAIVSNSGNLPVDAPIFTQGPHRPIVITSEDGAAQAKARLQSVADLLVAGERVVDPTRAVRALQGEYGIKRILLEGGPTLNYAFLRHRIVDELFWTVAPKLIGGKEELSLIEGEEIFDPLVQLKLISAYTYSDELFLRYKVL